MLAGERRVVAQLALEQAPGDATISCAIERTGRDADIHVSGEVSAVTCVYEAERLNIEERSPAEGALWQEQAEPLPALPTVGGAQNCGQVCQQARADPVLSIEHLQRPGGSNFGIDLPRYCLSMRSGSP
ncbi:MAG: hypothetical protein ACR2PL_08365 [Dehalococcoidia bacterium]